MRRSVNGITGGTMDLTSGSDALDATRRVIVDDGTLAVTAGDDGIHSDRRLEIHGGTIAIDRSSEGLEGTEIVIAGGSIDTRLLRRRPQRRGRA